MTSSDSSGILLSDLSTCQTGIYERISAYLNVFNDSLNLKTKVQRESLVRNFSPFVSKALEILSAKLVHRSNSNEKFSDELFRVYNRCLMCLEIICSMMVDQALILLFKQRSILHKCFVEWQRWEDADREGLRILTGLKKMQPLSSNLIVPDLVGMESNGSLLADTVLLLFLSAAKKESKNPDEYERLYTIAKEFQPWFRVFDKDLRRHVLSKQASHLVSCIVFLVGQVSHFKSKFDVATNLCQLIITAVVDSSNQGSSHLSQLCDSLYQIGVRMHSDNELEQASDVFNLHCGATWFIIQGKLKEEAKTDLSHIDILEFFDKWCEGSIFLFRVISQSKGTHEVQRAIKDSLKNWAEIFSERLPAPMSVVKQWVEIQMKIVKERENIYDEGTLLLGTSLSSSSKVSKKKILQQEFLSYVQMQNENPEFCKRMQMMIKGLLEENGFATPIDWLEESRWLRLCGIRGSKYCIQYLSQAIEVSSGHQLAVAHCLRSLCIEEEEPNSEEVFQDIQSALDVWLGMDPIASDGFLAPENTIKLLYSVIDLLSIKGRVDFHHKIYKVMIMIYICKNVPLSNCLAKLWESRRISHALCPSPIMESFMNLSNDFHGQLDSLKYWMDCLRESQPLVVGFKNNFYFPKGLSNNESMPQYNTTVDEVEEVASKLISSGSGSAYIAGYMYYDLCQRLVSNGRLVQALSFAMKAIRLRVELFEQKFPWSLEVQGGEYSKDGNDVLVRRSLATELWSFDSSSCDLEICYISPWNTLQCYLESIFQVGVIHELLGNGDEAKCFLQKGKDLSFLHRLTQFNIVFSSSLGELYHKQRRWAMAKEELQSAKERLKDSIKDGSCSKCRVMLEVTVEHNFIDLYQSSHLETDSTSLEKLPSDLYKEALAKLYTSEWKDSITCPKEQETITEVQQHEGNIERDHPNTFSKKDLSWDLDLESCVVSFGDDVPCICKTMMCWHCLTRKVMESGKVSDFVKWKWELIHRRLSLKLLTGLGKCLENRGQIHEAREIIFQSISVLVGPNSFYRATKSTFLPDLMGKEISAQRKHINLYHLLGREIPEDVLSVERGVILHQLCWLFLQNSNKDTSDNPNLLIDIPIPKLVSWLMLAFILCREVPVLFQKVSRLLAVIFSLSTSSVLQAPLSTSCKDLSGRHWVCFFHQASLGSQFNYQVSTKEVQQRAYTKGSDVAGSEDMTSRAQSLPRLAPESIQNLKDFVKHFFDGLPCTTVVCISLLGFPYTNMLQELLSCSSSPAWIMVSRLNLKSLPIHVLLPVHPVPVLGDDVANTGENDGEQWCDPWDSTVVDDVAPAFRLLLKKNVNLPKLPPNAAEGIWLSNLEVRRIIDDRLRTLLNNLEDSWFGSTLKYVLLGELSNCKDLDRLCEKLVKDLKSEFKDIDASLLKVILVGISIYGCKGGIPQVMLEFCLKRGCFYVSEVHSKEEKCAAELLTFASKLLEASKKARSFTTKIIKPIILVPDFEVQMLPWESLPVLRNHEVYRMPSVWSILAAYRNDHKINPLDAYYLLNPAGDLKERDVFEKLFKEKKLKGKVGHAPPVEELLAALASRDLFIYIGHGDGSKYVPNHRIASLQNCAGSFLMGCSSASLKLNGCYFPQGAPLAYLLAGSPVVFGNLWDVLEDEIYKFTKVMLASWFKDRSYLKDCDRKMMIGACMSRARDACNFFPYSVGAAPVCYGVPTELKPTMEIDTTELNRPTCLGKRPFDKLMCHI